MNQPLFELFNGLLSEVVLLVNGLKNPDRVVTHGKADGHGNPEQQRRRPDH